MVNSAHWQTHKEGRTDAQEDGADDRNLGFQIVAIEDLNRSKARGKGIVSESCRFGAERKRT